MDNRQVQEGLYPLHPVSVINESYLLLHFIFNGAKAGECKTVCGENPSHIGYLFLEIALTIKLRRHYNTPIAITMFMCLIPNTDRFIYFPPSN